MCVSGRVPVAHKPQQQTKTTPAQHAHTCKGGYTQWKIHTLTRSLLLAPGPWPPPPERCATSPKSSTKRAACAPNNALRHSTLLHLCAYAAIPLQDAPGPHTCGPHTRCSISMCSPSHLSMQRAHSCVQGKDPRETRCDLCVCRAKTCTCLGTQHHTRQLLQTTATNTNTQAQERMLAASIRSSKE